jgi:hypothetical protein
VPNLKIHFATIKKTPVAIKTKEKKLVIEIFSLNIHEDVKGTKTKEKEVKA